MEALGQAGSEYRLNIYSQGFSGETLEIEIQKILEFLDLAQQYIKHSLQANKRDDNLYHAYNILHLEDRMASIGRLNEMLEGQVAVLSSGMLSGEQSLQLLESLRHSRLYRDDQHSYILYPDRDLPGFLEKNCVTPEQVRGLTLVQELVNAQDKSLILRDEGGNYRFAGSIHNIKDVVRALDVLRQQTQYAEAVRQDTEQIKHLFENTFHHDEFTGRSGTFFAYEGLGSIYWHMVSKLLMAVQESILRTRAESSTPALIERYIDIRKGLSFNKTPADYGAFPTDPYSHTPKGQGARQPGMSGMVKEEILTRQMELGWSVEHGQLFFDFILLDKGELLCNSSTFSYWNIHGQREQIEMPAGSLAYTICQVPVLLQDSKGTYIEVVRTDGMTERVDGHVLDIVNSLHIFRRDGAIHHLVISCNGDES